MLHRRPAAKTPNFAENTVIYRRCIRRRYGYISLFGEQAER
jgi:hypothetical protein